eukprot:CAMPEP_0202704242 /NCGR_PEP_ID=MMETSP1385-20130828/16948_1 /ASSEMBLY_ACC=CAM_ASM_000861 /TAXON_ID=933848 /ORGANISM="Elphidium margaritaceum" /LENGTH=103 /DNA_ID=CAMNT_0049362219 /DNA_START=491 /DNA_END=802 /DNA_ORIENTATION=-
MAKYGRDANIGVGINDHLQAAPMMSYSFGVQGLYAGVAIDGTVLMPRNDCNAAFYGQNVEINDIVNGKVEPEKYALNEDYQQIIALLNSHSNADYKHEADKKN